MNEPGLDGPGPVLHQTCGLHDLELVTGNLRHFRRVPRLRLATARAETRRG